MEVRATHNELVDLPVVIILYERVEVPILPSRLERSDGGGGRRGNGS